MELDSTALPPNIAAAWGLRERPGKGPKPGLSLDLVVAAGIRVATAEGIGAVSMSKVAAAAGVSTMALYRYVRSKDELLELMVDACIDAPPPLDPALDWRDGLTAWAWAVRTVYLANAWALKAPISGPPATPHQLAWLEAGLHYLTGAPLSEAQKMSVMLLLSGYVRNEATLTADITAATAAASATMDDALAMYGKLLRMLVDPAKLPALGRVVEAGVLERADDPTEEFLFGLERILDGVGLLIARQA
ncbi:TetR family transcriptional regulator [Catellatospora sp. TT07R-123]|uniref:TetR/AcrR family transcriptional regulator n=1 Tax=Catellatospora sp. TT07R-123 TaxID=2733863 RepID=UPI001B212F0A|nr:TetR/AcrR family transcriptional regulator [Catellatospora sp. TT07R-123]GHJ50170.1 TetR family transcriptional regulator [Catellatospora sp. TT07R-123]